MRLIRFNLILTTFAFAALSISVFSGISKVEAAFGTSPPWVKNDHVLPGTTFKQTINLSRNEADEAMQVSIRIAGDEKLAEWIEIENRDNLIIKKGQNILPMKVAINTPKRAEIKEYRGSIFVTLVPVKEAEGRGGEVAITLGANIAVELTVIGDSVTDYRINSAAVGALKEGEEFGLTLVIENLGNTEIKELEGQVDIYDSTQSDILESLTFVPLRNPIPPDEIKVSKMIFEDTKLEPGEYWAFVKILKDGEVYYENRLLQKVASKESSVIAEAEDNPKKPALPGTVEDEIAEPVLVDEAPVPDLKPVAPTDDTDKAYLIFGLAGLALGLVAIIGLIVVVIILLNKQPKKNSSDE